MTGISPVKTTFEGVILMLSDIEIARSAKMKPIMEIAAGLGIQPEDVEPYGHYKAKLSENLYKKLESKPDGKLILVTAINPTPAGEGKTTVSVGLGQAMNRIGKKAVLALREPSLGPVFGIKGGAAGGGAERFPCGERYRGHSILRRRGGVLQLCDWPASRRSV